MGAVEGTPETHHRLSAIRREGERVTPLELFFDLVFVLAITQCTALMSHDQTWSGLAQGLLVLGVLWWAWVGYSWLTSVIDPEAEAVRLVIFVAMAALLIVSLSVQEAFDNLALTFALALGVFRTAHIALFMLAGADDQDLRRSVIGLAVSTAIAIGLLVIASLFDGFAQGALWALAIFLDMAGPYFFGAEGWKLVPGHFAERHGLIVIIALGESIVAIGVGASGALDFGIGAAAVLGVFLAAALWWTYFDVVALISARRLGEAEVGRVQNELARDSYSYIHLLMIAGIVLMALGMKVCARLRPARRARHLPARARRLPLPAREVDQPPPPWAGDRAPLPGPGGDSGRRADLPRGCRRIDLGDGPLRAPPLLRSGQGRTPPRSKRSPHLGILPEPFEHSSPPRQTASRRRPLRVRGAGCRGLARGRLLRRRDQRRRDRLDDRPRRRRIAAAGGGRPHRRDRPDRHPHR
ncbi:MAG: hypothetical protein E6G51_04845 [Actinobacteria bacterium]|nr:MAG: hypothetical protein E6G51_04845 [Actinomycetota bacterium]